MKSATFVPCGAALAGRLARALLVGLFVLAAPRLGAQIYLSSTDNYLSGNTYFEGDTEINGEAHIDGGIEVAQNLQIDQSAYVNGSISAWDVYADSIFYNYSAGQLTVNWSLELNSGFAPGMSVNWGVANSWIHSGIDLGDLTYTGTDTPAFNISEDLESGSLYPKIYFTGYDAATTWVWRQNGLAGMSNGSLLHTQMSLTSNGNLTLNDSTTGNAMSLNPANATINVSNANGSLTVSDFQSNAVTIDARDQSITFYNGSTHASSSITPQGSALTFNTTSSGQAYGSGASATAGYAFAMGNGASASGNGSFAIGNHVTAAYADSVVLGQWNAPISGSASGNTTWAATDPLLVVGNGADASHTANALVILKNGDTAINGNLSLQGNATFNGPAVVNSTVNFTGNVTVQPQGDILMGAYGN